MVESTGKTPLESMVMARHQTLPAGLIHKDGSGADRSAAVRGEHTMPALTNTQSEDNLIFRCVAEQQQQQQQQHSLSSDSQHPVGNMTTSMTISSMTSYCGTPPQKSPVCTETGRNPFSAPPSPKISGSHSRNSTKTAGNSAPLVNGHFPLGHLPHHGSVTIPTAATQYAYHNMTYINTGQPLSFLSPFCVTPSNFPASPSHFPGSPATFQPSPAPNIVLPQSPQTSPVGHQSAQTPIPSYCPSLSLIHHPSHVIVSTNSQPHQSHLTSTSQLHSSHSPLPHRDSGQSDLLLREITRLRERLAQLEGENSALTVKLNQQQWDVESRLTELEMHICQSDSVASTDFDGDSLRLDSKSLSATINRESVI